MRPGWRGIWRLIYFQAEQATELQGRKKSVLHPSMFCRFGRGASSPQPGHGLAGFCLRLPLRTNPAGLADGSRLVVSG